jgi:hypothetical protein
VTIVEHAEADLAHLQQRRAIRHVVRTALRHKALAVVAPAVRWMTRLSIKTGMFAPSTRAWLPSPIDGVTAWGQPSGHAECDQ